MKKLTVIIIGIVLMTSPGYALHDVTCYDIIEPGTDYVQDGVANNPRVGVANLGEQAEEDFPVIFRSLVVEDGSTHYEDTVWVDDIGPYPDSIEVEFPPWTPESKCNEDEPWVEYDCYGITELFHDVDENPENDTAYELVTGLWEHDVGVYNIIHTDFDADPDIYYVGTEVNIIAEIENYGISKEYDVPVSCEIINRTADPDTIVYYNVQYIDSIDWRGNTEGNSYVAEVEFEPWIAPHPGWFVIQCRTELVGDMCPDNDFENFGWFAVAYPNTIEETETPLTFRIDVTSVTESVKGVSFTIPTAQRVLLSLFDVNGCRVQTLVNDSYPAGTHEINWSTEQQSPGVYFVRFEAGDYRVTEKAVIIR